MTTTIEKTDADLKKDVLAELEFEPSVQITEIGVLVKDGVVTLNGRASDHGARLNAVRAVKRVSGVTAIADDIEVSLPVFGQHSDSDIAASAAARLDWSTELPAGAVEVTVSEGRITLDGVVEWGYQKHAAEQALQNLAGVTGISNLIKVSPSLAAAETGTEIAAAIRRSALLDGTGIQVESSGSSVKLSGKVRNHAQLEEAVRLAWAAPGVHTVDNQVKVDWFGGLAD
jgi:osmotically-inducible protein OsmY